MVDVYKGPSYLRVVDLVDKFVDSAVRNLEDGVIPNYEFSRRVCLEVAEQVGIEEEVIDKLYAPCLHWGMFCGDFANVDFDYLEKGRYSDTLVRKIGDVDLNDREMLKLKILAKYDEVIEAKCARYLGDE